MTPRVSIITTVYDRVDCLRRCLRSVQHLWYRDVEHLVISNHPPQEVHDTIAALCAEFGAEHLNMPVRTQDWGLSPAMMGLRESSGDYVCFLSDDNAYLPNHFAALVETIDADPGLGFVYSSCLYDGRKELRFPYPVGAGIDLGQPLFRRDLLTAYVGTRNPFSGTFSWDWELIRALMENGMRWQHIDALTFVFKLERYPALMEALA